MIIALSKSKIWDIKLNNALINKGFGVDKCTSPFDSVRTSTASFLVVSFCS
jgi:hypothetical protein